MKTTSYQILTELEAIIKADTRTKSYNIQGAEDPDFPPISEGCPMINIFPATKDREQVRLSNTPYVVKPAFNIIMWEVSLGNFKDAFKRIDIVEENIYKVLMDNKKINGLALTSEISETNYEHIYYENTFYIKATLILTPQINR